MPREATIPAPTDVLCENCGYVLNGLPPDSNCPECGRPTAESDPALRNLTAWEQADDDGQASGSAFLATSAAILFRPTRFYRTLATRTDTPRAAAFAQIYWILASMLFGLAACAHATWFILFDPLTPIRPLTWVGLSAIVYASLVLTTRLAAWLTNWEATYRGYRLTLRVVRRGLGFHAIHYVPVALVVCLTVLGYAFFVRRGTMNLVQTTTTYLYVLCGEVVVAAAYLFKTYWTAMRNMMFANA